MLVPRGVFLALAGVELGAFKPLQARDQIPSFGTAEYKGNRGYLPIDAVVLAIADLLAQNTALDRDAIKTQLDGSVQLFVQMLEFEDDVPAFLLVLFHGEWPEFMVGRYDELVADVRTIDGFEGITSITLIRVDQVLAGIKKRAKNLGLELLPHGSAND